MPTITVTNLYDNGTGSLRQALLDASSGDTITFDPGLAGETLTLTSGELDITKNLTIEGDVDGNGTADITIDAADASRVFRIENSITATLDGLVMVNGHVDAENGGGIAVGQNDTLTVSNSRLSNNSASYSAGMGGGNGGAISVASGSTLTLLNSTLAHNSAEIGGGGIYEAQLASVNVLDSTLSGNHTGSLGTGGAIDVVQSTLTLLNATLSGSEAYRGGAIYESSGTVTVYDSTLTGDLDAQAAGGIAGSFGTVTIGNSIIVGNSGGINPDVFGSGTHFIFKGNSVLQGGAGVANGGTVDHSQGYYSRLSSTSLHSLKAVFALVGNDPDTGIHAGLLANNGGPVETAALNIAANGIAHDHGQSNFLPPDTFDLNNNGDTTEPLPVDARGIARVAGGSVDIGAFEQQPGANFVVTTLADETYDGGTLAQETADGGGLSLREALGLANQDPTATYTITFTPGLISGSTHGVDDGVLLLTHGELAIDSNVTIDGDLHGDGSHDITIDGQGGSRDFVITGGNETVNQVTLNGLTITGGYVHGSGGGIALRPNGYGELDVSISNSIVTSNNADYGGGIYVDSGDFLQLRNSVVSGNNALNGGGGIANYGALALYGSTISGNTSGYIGGGIANYGLLAAVNSTIANNHLSNVVGLYYTSAGAGLYNAGEAALENTTIAGNTGAFAGGGIYNSLGLFLINVTIANNSANNGGGLYNAAYCGCGNAFVYDSTFTGNYAKQHGGGIANANGTVTLRNTIVAGNQGSDVENGFGTTYYAGVNLFSQSGIGRSGIDIVQSDLTKVFASLTTIDPDGIPNSGDEFLAGTLGDNGGPVETVVIKLRGDAQNTGSTADLPPDLFDLNGNVDTTEPLPFDARGALRVFGSAVDIGAVEAQAPVARNDFTDDGKSDLLWQNADGTPAIWNMNGTAITGGGLISNPGAAWHVEASADFDNDSKADIVVQNNDGLPQIWLMNGTSVASTVSLANPGPSWHGIALDDFNNDGNADILWQNNDGAAAIWEMNGTTPIGGGVLPINPGAAWHVIGAGDVDGDGNADILWQNNDGTAAIWEMNGTNVVGGGLLPNPGSQWHAIGLGDFNGDGNADILWQANDGMPAIWELNGTSIIGGGLLVNPGATWHAIGTSDFNGDTKADIVWQNDDGTPAIWEMNGTAIIGGGLLLNPGATWHVKDDGPVAPNPAGSASQAIGLHVSAPDGASGLPAAPSGMRPLFAGAS